MDAPEPSKITTSRRRGKSEGGPACRAVFRGGPARLWYGGAVKIVDFRALARYSADKMQKTDVFVTPRAVVELFCLEAGQAQRSTKHTESDKSFFILEGTGRFTVGRTTRELNAGTAVLVSPGEEHGVVNIGEERLLVLVFTAPPPEKV